MQAGWTFGDGWAHFSPRLDPQTKHKSSESKDNEDQTGFQYDYLMRHPLIDNSAFLTAKMNKSKYYAALPCPDLSVLLPSGIEKHLDKQPGKEPIEKHHHITLHINLPHKPTPDLVEKIQAVAQFQVSIGDLGCFENENNDVLYAKVQVTLELLNLHKLLVAEYNQPWPRDSFTPHLTLAFLQRGTAKAYVGEAKSTVTATMKMVEFRQHASPTKDPYDFQCVYLTEFGGGEKKKTPGCPLTHDKHKEEGECWYELPVVLPQKYTDWLAKNVPEHLIKEKPKPHITVLYGFDCKHYATIAEIVEGFKITPQDYEFGEIQKGQFAPIYLVHLKSSKLQTLFAQLYMRFPNHHTLIKGKYEPHVTLCWLKE